MTTPIDSSGLIPTEARPQPVTQPQAVEANILYTLINAAAATINSEFVDIRNFSKFALEVDTSADSDVSVQLVGSCLYEQPSADSGAGYDLGSAVTSAGITFPSLAGVRWVQAQLVNTSSDAVTVLLSAIAP
jgi:hypothetical protein